MQLTDNCLADARLASHDLHVERQQTALLTVINMAASVVAISHDHYLNIRQHGAVESPQLQADAGLLCIAIANLLDNAVKYSPPVKSPSIFIPMPGKRSYAFATTARDSRRTGGTDL